MRKLPVRLLAVLTIAAVIALQSVAAARAILPAAAAAVLIVISARPVARHLSTIQVVLGVLTISLSILSLWALKRMFLDGAWATYLPYHAIAGAAAVALIQTRLARPG